MKKIEVCIRGRNLLVKSGKEVRKKGFYAARFIEANDISTAVGMAMDSFRTELGDVVVNDKSDPPVMTVIEASEVYYFDETMSVEGKVLPGEGFLWEDEGEPGRPAGPWSGSWLTLRNKIKEGDLHIHSMLIHFTNALYPVASVFIFLSLIFNKAAFDKTYFYIMVLATLSVPFSYASGILEWKKRYQGAKKEIFYAKIRYGVPIFILGGGATLWRALSPEILTDGGLLTVPFILLNLSVLPIIVYLGHLGGVIVYEGTE